MIGNSRNRLSFSQYIERCCKSLQEKQSSQHNSPFELIPQEPIPGQSKQKYGILLIHGLFDSPFSIKDLAEHLCQQGLLCRAVLLPGHGSTAEELLDVSYQEWIETVGFGIETLKHDVENIILVGYSTGAALAAYYALNDPSIKGIVMLAPLVKIKTPVSRLLHLDAISKWFNKHRQWLVKHDEIDYVKYTSITFNSVKQVAQLTTVVNKLQQQKSLSCPIFMALSNEDKVISSKQAINLFLKYHHPDSELLLYTLQKRVFKDKRISVRHSHFPEYNIRGFSHIALPFSPTNPHYGQHGDFVHASLLGKQNVYGTYGHLQIYLFEMLRRLGVVKNKRMKLTYNPDFDYMVDKIVKFILSI